MTALSIGDVSFMSSRRHAQNKCMCAVTGPDTHESQVRADAERSRSSSSTLCLHRVLPMVQRRQRLQQANRRIPLSCQKRVRSKCHRPWAASMTRASSQAAGPPRNLQYCFDHPSYLKAHDWLLLAGPIGKYILRVCILLGKQTVSLTSPHLHLPLQCTAHHGMMQCRHLLLKN